MPPAPPPLLTLCGPATPPSPRRIVSSLIDNGAPRDAPASETKSYLYLDPKLPPNRTPHEAKGGAPFSQCIVFVAGGGAVSEHLNLQVRTASPVQAVVTMFSSSHFIFSLAFRVVALCVPQELAARKTEAGHPTSIAYAATEISSPDAFLSSLAGS